jgi:hypothetical protein
MEKNGHSNTPFALGAISLLQFFGMEAFGPGALAKGMDDVRELAATWKAKIRYCQPNDVLTDLAGRLDGMRIFVLGPPRDRKLLRRTEARGVHYERLAASEEAFFAAVSGGGAAPDYRPFENGIGARLSSCIKRINQADPSRPELDPYIAFLKAHYVSETADRRDQSWRRIDAGWYGAAAEFALQLDGATNNTSLVLAIQDIKTGNVFLFPGDAQVGNWQGWKQCSWSIVGDENQADKTTVTVDDLLRETVFYKVGHHGSQNATMRQDGLEKMTSHDLVAAIPVDEETARKLRWNFMPLANLLIALKAATKTRTVRADENYVNGVKQNALQDRITENKLYQEIRFDL